MLSHSSLGTLTVSVVRPKADGWAQAGDTGATALRKVRSPPLEKMMARSDILESSRRTLALLQSHFYELCETPFHPQTLNKVWVPNCACSDEHIHAHIVYIHLHYNM